MIITAIKAAAFIAFFGMTVGLTRPAVDRHAQAQPQDAQQQMCSEDDEGSRQEA